MAAGETAHQICVPWDKLLMWVQQQIAAEMQTGQPVALTRSQLEAISEFISFNDEPDVSDKDYVSLLLQKTQSRRLLAPVFANPEPVNMPVDGHLEPRWRCSCTIQSYGEFPRRGFGFSAGQQAPLFQSKKNAKQFAAKQALDFLSHSPGNNKSPVISVLNNQRPSLPSSLPQKRAPPNLESPPKARLVHMPSPMASQANNNNSEGSSTSGTTSPRQSSVFEQVSLLTGRLGVDSPSYKIEPDPAGGDYFSGRPIFKNGGRVPPDLGFVSGVAGLAQAKLRVAEEVLAWAETELQRRQDIYQSLWGPPAT
ncbi:hypothetical protein C2857_006072 [Epichloe festucae Fl1]|uniref:DRBM domain-containing protein n=1 Tax=Epichloe festucae (strain Fl1) TaxID=877507 RepID=A0A7S9KT76_EPIFF|nr:hypothetical protein C2857_006072 [Epichloe festucae Fl1]